MSFKSQFKIEFWILFTDCRKVPGKMLVNLWTAVNIPDNFKKVLLRGYFWEQLPQKNRFTISFQLNSLTYFTDFVWNSASEQLNFILIISDKISQ